MTRRASRARSRRVRRDPLEDLAMDWPGRGRRRCRFGPCRPRTGVSPGRRSCAARGAKVVATGPSDLVERDERDVDDGEIDRLGERRRRSASRAFVRSIDVTRGSRRSASASWPRPDVDRVDVARAALQQHVGEAAGRGTDVEAAASRPGRSPNASSAAASLWPPRLTYGSGRSTSIGGSGSTGSPGLRSRRAASPSPTRTLPASTRAWPLLRVSASPRSTSSSSSRTRVFRPTVDRTTVSWHSPLHAASLGGAAPCGRPPRPVPSVSSPGSQRTSSSASSNSDGAPFVACQSTKGPEGLAPGSIDVEFADFRRLRSNECRAGGGSSRRWEATGQFCRLAGNKSIRGRRERTALIAQ